MPEHDRLRGYETWLGTNRVQEDASVLIADQLLGMVELNWVATSYPHCLVVNQNTDFGSS